MSLDQPYVYVVTRDGRRVSHTNHQTRESAIEESKYWTRVIHRADPRSMIRIVHTDKPRKIK
jgi:hypothetical protein